MEQAHAIDRTIAPGPLDPVEGYRRWAPRYEAETAISFLENHLVRALSPSQAGRRLLDAGCGTGRRLLASDAAVKLGVEPSPEMRAAGGHAKTIIPGDVRALPVENAAFDEAWCRLVLGHIAELNRAYAELARALRPGGTLVVSDFHPDALAAGHRRTFRDADGVHEIVHHDHSAAAHLAAAVRAGLHCEATREGAVGPDLRPFYADAGKLAAFAAQQGLRVVIAWRFAKEPGRCAG